MKKITLAIAVVVVLAILQLFFRYETVKIGPIELKRDKLTSTIYVRSTADRTWKEETRFNDFNRAKAYYQRAGWDLVLYK